jgi:hypothetical protein
MYLGNQSRRGTFHYNNIFFGAQAPPRQILIANNYYSNVGGEVSVIPSGTALTRFVRAPIC